MPPKDFKTVIARADDKLRRAYDALTDKNTPIAVLGGTVDVEVLSPAQLKGLLNGPKADIFVGDKLAFRNAPIRALMAWSHSMNARFTDNPLVRKVTLDKSIDIDAVQIILKTTITPTGMGGEKVVSVVKGVTLKQRILIYQAGVALGMNERAKYHGDHLKHYISKNLAPYDVLNLVIKSIPANDPVFRHLAKNLAYRRYKGTILDTEEFGAWLKKHGELSKAMNEADAPYKELRKAAYIAKAQDEKHQASIDQSA